MFAQVIRAAVSPRDRPEAARIVREDLVPALLAEDGFSGAVGMVETDTCCAMMIAFWEREAQAAVPPDRRGPRFRAALADLDGLACGPRSISVWDVGVEV
jgi:hypothetical protein